MLNPYTWRTVVRDPDMFYGREKELSEVASRLCGNIPLNISVIGPRRIGKSSMLWHISRSSSKVLPANIYERFVFLYLDFQEVGTLSIDRILAWILQKLVGETAFSGRNESDLKDLLREKLADLEQERKYLVLVFDEFDSAVRYMSAETLDYLRALAKYNVAYIVATKQPLSEICITLESSPFSNIFTVLPIGLLPWPEAYNLVVEPSSQYGVDFTDTDIDFILNIAGCHPFLLQIVSFYVFENRKHTRGPLDYKGIKKSVATDVMPFIQRTFYSLSETAKDGIVAVIKGRNPPALVLDELQRLAVIDEDGKLAGSLFKEFAHTFAKEREGIYASGTLEQEVDDLLEQLEQEMRDFLARHLQAKYGSDWPTDLQKRNHSKFQIWLQRMPREARNNPERWQDILKYTDFPDPFQIISWEWGDLKGVFPFSRDTNKSKRRLEERQEFLTGVRNAVRHSRTEDLTEFDLEKARLFCRELLAMLSEAFDQG
ncbi:MAG: ATP-binding protein [Methanobacteriota archaeon]|nr:MAG: ATP-binding protein [Euryarchaeota archaeon]